MSDRTQTNRSAADRAYALDLWRFLAIGAMLCYHFAFDLNYFGYCGDAFLNSLTGLAIKYFCSGSFIVICGICCIYSHDNIRRGFRLLVIAFLITVITTLFGVGISFGILHFLGFSTIVYGIYERKHRLSSSWLVFLSCIALFGLSFAITSAVNLPFDFLSFLGLRGGNYGSMDYYPVFPWLFLFINGVWSGCRYGEKIRHMKLLGKERKLIKYISGHSLAIYLIHQPVFILLFYFYGKFFY